MKAVLLGLRRNVLTFLGKFTLGEESIQMSPLDTEVAEIGRYGWGNNGVAENVTVRNEAKSPHLFGIDPFYIVRGDQNFKGEVFQLLAPTTARNALRVLRAMQLPKLVLLEGSPGVGKTSLVVALANLSGHNIVRINLSEEAIKSGSWVLLDELNLAPQSVLEAVS
ncbi:Midasin [Nymphaea thermarum]|nr:Midasin [Nymphaea thermarum]